MGSLHPVRKSYNGKGLCPPSFEAGWLVPWFPRTPGTVDCWFCEVGELKTVRELAAEVEALRDRLARLGEASLRVSESLDVTTVLHEVVESARVLTGARYGVITASDDSVQIPEFVTSGLEEQEYSALLEFDGRWELYRYLRELPEPLKLSDLGSHIRSLGIPGDLPGRLGLGLTFLSSPMRHRGAQVGNFCVGGKEAGQEFTAEDQEVLAMFASQAASAVANARRHRDEQRARADLEALIDTAPVGVVVLEARTGSITSLNREARRIVGELRMPGRSLEQLLEVVRVRWADGREVALDEFPLTKLLGAATRVRAEEIALEVPDGRSVTTLVNATPIRTGDERAESLVVTLQDMTPLEDLERLRAEFLAMVSHELRAPLASIKGCSATVLGAAGIRDPAELLQFFRIIDEQADRMSEMIGDLLDAGRIETGTLLVDPQPAEVIGLLDQARKAFLNVGGRNPLQLEVPPDLPPVQADHRRIVQVLGTLLANAAEQSPESSPVRVAAVREGDRVAISVTDQGQGVPADRLPYLFRKFSRARDGEAGGGIAGSGMGLAICKGLVEAHGGRIQAASGGAGQGTRFTFTLPTVQAAAAAAQADPIRTTSAAGPAVQGQIRILVADRDLESLRYVRQALARAGYSALVTADPAELPGLIETGRPSLALVDRMLCGTDETGLIKQVPALADLPVIFLSGYGGQETSERAFEAGAADYLVRPFSPTELVARVAAALRRSAERREPFRLGELAIDYDQRRVSVAGQPVQLTSTEYEVLRELSVHSGRVLTHDTLLRRVWKSRDSGDRRLIRAIVKNLRRKLGDDANNPRFIFTQSRVGYRMAQPADR